MFIRNRWYIAATSSEVSRTLLKRTIVGVDLVMFRTDAGEPVALFDRCPHRLAPLSMGRLIGDELQCGYHGIRFDSHGLCVHIPGASARHIAPAKTCERSHWSNASGGFGYGLATLPRHD